MKEKPQYIDGASNNQSNDSSSSVKVNEWASNFVECSTKEKLKKEEKKKI